MSQRYKQDSLVARVDFIVASYKHKMLDDTSILALKQARKEQWSHEQYLLVTLMMLKREIEVIGREDVIDLFDDMVTMLEEISHTPIADVMNTHHIEMENECWLLKPNDPNQAKFDEMPLNTKQAEGVN